MKKSIKIQKLSDFYFVDLFYCFIFFDLDKDNNSD